MVTVRPARPGDVPGIRCVARAGWHAAYGGILSEAAIETALSSYYDPETVERAVVAEDVVHLVAVDDVGYASATGGDHAGSDQPGAELANIYVGPDRWGEGVGSRLFAALARRLRERGFERVRAVVLAENDAGRPFYEAREFERVGTREEVIAGETHEALVVARDL